jgi:hypothetical protein
MESREQPRTPLADDEKTLLSDEWTNMDDKLAKILNDIDTDQ